jgi:hypothetical protein
MESRDFRHQLHVGVWLEGRNWCIRNFKTSIRAAVVPSGQRFAANSLDFRRGMGQQWREERPSLMRHLQQDGPKRRGTPTEAG